MSAAPFDKVAAIDAAEENYALRRRIHELESEEQARQRAMERQPQLNSTMEASAIEKSKANISATRDRIATLEKELAELRVMNATELHHEYKRLDTKRAHLASEIASLRNILANQSKGVKKATRAVNNHQETRRQNEESHAASKSEMLMFKEKRDTLTKETQRLIRQEGRLEEEIASLPMPGEKYEVVVARLEEEGRRKDAVIAKLERTLEEEQGSASTEVAPPPTTEPEANMEALRSEYVQLSEQLKQQRAVAY